MVFQMHCDDGIVITADLAAIDTNLTNECILYSQ